MCGNLIIETVMGAMPLDSQVHFFILTGFFSNVPLFLNLKGVKNYDTH